MPMISSVRVTHSLPKTAKVYMLFTNKAFTTACSEG